VHSLPCCAGAPQGLWQLTGQTHPFMATAPSRDLTNDRERAAECR